MEACPGSEDVVGKEAQIGVVVLQGFVVTPALHGDAVLGAGQFVLQTEEILI